MNPTQRAQAALDLEHYWMPFTDNRRFKQAPKPVAPAKDMFSSSARRPTC